MKKICVALAVVGLLCPGVAFAGRLEMGNARVDGDTVTIPINLTGDIGDGVAAMDFRMSYDPQVLEPVEAGPGPAASQAGKTVNHNSSQPGSYTLVIMGLNQSVMQTGEVATVTMRRVGEPTGGSSNVRILDTTFASITADEIPSRGDSQNLRFDGSQPDEEPEPEEDPQEEMEDEPQQASNSNQDSQSSPSQTATPAGRRATPGNPSDPGSPQQVASAGGAPSGGAGVAPSGDGTAATSSGSSSSSATAGNRTQAGERMNTAVSQASGARSSLPAPQASPSGQSSVPKSGSPATGATSTTLQATEPDYSNVTTIDLAQGDTPVEGAMPQANASVSDSGSTSEEAAPPGTTPTAAAAPTTPAADAGDGPNMTVMLIVGGVVGVGIIGLLFLRKRLFA